MSNFSPADLAAIREILASEVPLHTGKTPREHVQHCFDQCRRFPWLTRVEGKPFRYTQWGFNLGRAQEILKSHGGKEAWWCYMEPLIDNKDWVRLEEVLLDYSQAFGLSVLKFAPA